MRGLVHAGPRLLVNQVPALGLQLQQELGQQVRVTVLRGLQVVGFTAHAATRSLLHACPPAWRQHQDRQGCVVLAEVAGRVKKMLRRLLINFPRLEPDLDDGAFLPEVQIQLPAVGGLHRQPVRLSMLHEGLREGPRRFPALRPHHRLKPLHGAGQVPVHVQEHAPQALIG